MTEGNSQITIRRAIVHKIDHLADQAPWFSELESPVTDCDVQEFLIKQISDSRSHKNARDAVFTAPADRQPALHALCEVMAASPEIFIEHSRTIADRLLQSIKGDRRVSTGDLVILIFTEQGEDLPWVGLLKMDEKSGFVGDPQTVDGKTRIVLRKVPNVLTNSDLQKCAFVLPKERQTDRRHLIVLDQQIANYGSRLPAASFFIGKFLQCEVGGNAREKTRVFNIRSSTWADGEKGVWSDEQIEEFKEQVREAIRGSLVDVEAIAHMAIEDPDDQKAYVEYVRSGMEQAGFYDLVFRPDPKALKLVEYVHFEGDNGLNISIQADAFGPDKTLTYEYDERTGIRTLRIRSSNWAETRKLGSR